MSIKEDAIMRAGPAAMSLLEGWTAKIKPENEISKFIEDHISDLFEQQNEEINMAQGLLIKMSVDEANKNPEYVLSKLLKFYDHFRVFYVDYTSTPPAPTRLENEDTTEDTTEDATNPE